MMAPGCQRAPLSGDRYRFKEGSKLQKALNDKLSGTMFGAYADVSFLLILEDYIRLRTIAVRTAIAKARAVHPLGIGYVPTKREVTDFTKMGDKALRAELFGQSRTCTQNHVNCDLLSQLTRTSGIGR